MARKPGPRSNKKKQKIPSGYLVLGAGALALVFVLRPGKNRSTPMAADVPPPATTKGTQVQMLPETQARVDVRKYQEELDRDRAQLARARGLGLKNLPLKNQGDTVLIPLSFVPEKVWCQGGDLDTMKYASKNRETEDFVISLEALDGRGTPLSIRTSLAALWKGLDHTFTLPKPKDAKSYGLYICSDSRKENSCQQKTIQSHAAVSEELGANREKIKGEDRVFFFQNLVIDGKSVEAYRTNDFSSEFQKSIKGHLAKKGLSAADVQTAWKNNETLQSVPVDIRKDKIILTLPYNDPRCMQPKGE